MTAKTRPILLGLILLSGFSALIYEITWSRHLSLLFGSNMLAVGTATATFMAGLAIGSLLFGARADRSKNPLRLYALLEVGIAITALLFPLTLKLIGLAFIPLAQSYPESSVLLTAVRIALAALALLPPTICMGGTLPVLCRFLASRQLGRLVGQLYALNTLGAVAGCLLGGFLLIPHFGMFNAQATAITINLAIAGLAWKLSHPVETSGASESTSTDAPANFIPTQLLLGGAALLGMSALAFEMLWTRLFLLFLGNTTYAFATILGVFLCGLTLGGGLYSRFLATRTNQPLVYLSLLTGMLLFILATLPFYDQLGYLFESIHRSAENHWWFLSIASFFAVTLPVLLPAIFSGALFPATVSLLKPEQTRAGKVTGQTLFWNTLGAMTGSFLGVYAITLFGLQNSFKAVALFGFLYATVFLWAYRMILPTRIAILPLAACLLLLSIPLNWNQGLLNSGIYIYSHYYLQTGGLGNPATTAQPEEVIEGLETTAAFFRTSDGFKEFRVNGKSDGGTRPGDMKTQILLGQLPMLFNPDADSALVIGLGTGITLRQTLDYPTVQVDCAEISPEVAKIARHFSRENEQVLDSPRVRLLIQDGRNLLLTRGNNYDVIISEPSNPWQTGNANLFTREFYTLARTRLTATGIFCQWLPLYDLPTAKLKVALQTFADSFPHIRVFLLGGDIILLGSNNGQSLDLNQFDLSTHSKSTLSHLAQAGIASSHQLRERYYFGNATLLKEAAGTAPLNTDDLPHLEFTRQTGRNLSRINLGYLVEVRQRLGVHGTR